MFKIPNWEDDVPKSNVDFGKTSKSKKDKKLLEAVKSPPKSTNLTKTIKVDIKSNKKNKNNLNKRSTGPQSKVNGFSSLNKRGNGNSTLKPNNKKPNQQQQHKYQQKQSPIKNTENSQSQLNGNTTQSNKTGYLSKPSTDKPKKKRSKKRKFESVESTSTNDTKTQQDGKEDEIDISNPSKPKKKKNNDPASTITANKKKKGDQTDILESDLNLTSRETKVDKKKEKLRKLLKMENNRNSINVSGNKLRERMLERLKAAQFRFLNEKLYTTSGSEAQKLFQSDPDAFHTYHQGYQQQLKKWPVNPLDLIVKRISKMPKTHIIADMGCGSAALSKRVPQPVRSFDLVAGAPGVEPCDMAHTPLLSESVDATVYCLALMGTDLTQYLVEANRVLKVGGHLLIAEVESRFEKPEAFADDVQRLGFKLKNLDKSHQVFYFLEFTKIRAPPAKKSKLPVLTLKPCFYKKR